MDSAALEAKRLVGTKGSRFFAFITCSASGLLFCGGCGGVVNSWGDRGHKGIEELVSVEGA